MYNWIYTGMSRTARKNGKRGGAMLELVFVAPWLVFLFIGAVDWGFYSYALISVQNATRVAALYTSSGAGTAADQGNACSIVRTELVNLPNIASSPAACDSGALVVTATALKGPDNADASDVTVTYQTVPLIPIPGLLGNQYTFTRHVQMRLRS